MKECNAALTRVCAAVGVCVVSARRRVGAVVTDDRGMNTAEYAVGTLAAVAFAGLLLKVLTSGSVTSALTAIIERALQ
jgi:hypothetical protein